MLISFFFLYISALTIQDSYLWKQLIFFLVLEVEIDTNNFFLSI